MKFLDFVACMNRLTKKEHEKPTDDDIISIIRGIHNKDTFLIYGEGYNLITKQQNCLQLMAGGETLTDKELIKNIYKNYSRNRTVPDVIVNAEVVERIASIINVDIFELEINKTDTGFELNCTDSTTMLKNKFLYLYMLLFSDDVEIVKKPWKPKKGERYYFINRHNNVEYDWFDDTYICDRYRYVIGNCFKTYSKAEKHKNDVLKILNGEPLVKWEE